MTTIGRPRAAALLISGSLLLCGSPRPAPAATKGSAKASVRSAGATPPARAAVLPVVPPTDPTVFASAGPYLAGVTTLAIATFGPSKTKTAEVWYPVQPLNSRRITTETLYDLRQMLPRSQSRLLGKQIGAVQKTEAARGARITPGGPFPVVVFSHGFGGFATQSAFLMTHLATWGFVVIAPDHPSRDIAAVLSGKFSFNERDDVDDLRASVAALGGSAFRQSIDLNNLAALGHSAGADAVVRWSAGEPRVQGLIVMAGGVSGMSGKLPEPRISVSEAPHCAEGLRPSGLRRYLRDRRRWGRHARRCRATGCQGARSPASARHRWLWGAQRACHQSVARNPVERGGRTQSDLRKRHARLRSRPGDPRHVGRPRIR